MNKKILIVLVVGLVLLIGGGVAYYLYSRASASPTASALTKNKAIWANFLRSQDPTKFQTMLTFLATKGGSSTTTPTTSPGPTLVPTLLKNVTFYPTTTSELYSDKKADWDESIVSACVIKDMSGKTIKAKYQDKEGQVVITKGSSPGCPSTVKVEEGTFTPTTVQEKTLK